MSNSLEAYLVSLLNEFSELTRCQICFDSNKPLCCYPCGHSFCESCITSDLYGLVKSNVKSIRRQCASCQTEHTLKHTELGMWRPPPIVQLNSVIEQMSALRDKLKQLGLAVAVGDDLVAISNHRASTVEVGIGTESPVTYSTGVGTEGPAVSARGVNTDPIFVPPVAAAPAYTDCGTSTHTTAENNASPKQVPPVHVTATPKARHVTPESSQSHVSAAATPLAFVPPELDNLFGAPLLTASNKPIAKTPRAAAIDLEQLSAKSTVAPLKTLEVKGQAQLMEALLSWVDELKLKWGLHSARMCSVPLNTDQKLLILEGRNHAELEDAREEFETRLRALGKSSYIAPPAKRIESATPRRLGLLPPKHSIASSEPSRGTKRALDQGNRGTPAFCLKPAKFPPASSSSTFTSKATATLPQAQSALKAPAAGKNIFDKSRQASTPGFGQGLESQRGPGVSANPREPPQPTGDIGTRSTKAPSSTSEAFRGDRQPPAGQSGFSLGDVKRSTSIVFSSSAGQMRADGSGERLAKVARISAGEDAAAPMFQAKKNAFADVWGAKRMEFKVPGLDDKIVI